MVTTASSPSPAGNRWQRLLPGLALGGAVTAAAFLLRSLELPGLTRLSPLMLAIMIGMLVRNTLGRPEAARAGLAFSLRGPLRLGIILLGLQVTLAEILGIGWSGLLILAFALLSRCRAGPSACHAPRPSSRPIRWFAMATKALPTRWRP